MGNRPEIIGHGGAGHFFPGNSRQSLEAALRIGVDRIEFDVQRAVDGALVLVHDEKLRMAGGRLRAVRALTSSELAARLPGLLTLDEAIELIGNRACILIDVKAPGYERPLIEAIKRHGLGDESGVSSTYANSLLAIRRAVPGIRIGLSTGHLAGSSHNALVRRTIAGALGLALPDALGFVARTIGATDVMVHYRTCTPRLVEHMHRHGLRVTCWTVDQPRHIRRLLDLGVDGITSNRPDLVRELVTARYGDCLRQDDQTRVGS